MTGEAMEEVGSVGAGADEEQEEETELLPPPLLSLIPELELPTMILLLLPAAPASAARFCSVATTLDPSPEEEVEEADEENDRNPEVEFDPNLL